MDFFFKEINRLHLQCQKKLSEGKNPYYQKIIENLPDVLNVTTEFQNDAIEISASVDANQKQIIADSLKKLKPWRKGPFKIFDVFIDTEWKSHLKWNRLKNHLPDLNDKIILDIGASSGYYMFKMCSYKPKIILGVDPWFLYYFQFLALQKYIQKKECYYLPIEFESLKNLENTFDVIFCMGILYHQKNPVESLKQIKNLLKTNGTLILEGLYIDGQTDTFLKPASRYAMMKNVYYVPTIVCLKNWLKESGFSNCEIISLDKTTLDEQRQTEWIDSWSLEKFLDAKDMNKTVEGHPAPQRFLLKTSS